MRCLFFRFGSVVGLSWLELGLGGLPEIGAEGEVIHGLVELQRFELNAKLEFVRRRQMRKSDGKAARTRPGDNFSLHHHRSVLLEVYGERSCLTADRCLGGLDEAPAETE